MAHLHNNNLEYAKKLCEAAAKQGYVRQNPDFPDDKEEKEYKVGTPWASCADAFPCE